MSNRLYWGKMTVLDLGRLVQCTRAEILVYTALIIHSDNQRECKISHNKLKMITGASVSTVKRAIKKFEKRAWLEKSIYFQIRKYTLTLTEELDHSDDPVHLDDPGHSDELTVGHSDGPLTEKKQRKTTTTIHPADNEEIIFAKLFARWSTSPDANWTSEEHPLVVYRRLKSITNRGVNRQLELQIIDSWLLLQRADKTGRVWTRNYWVRGLERWFMGASPRHSAARLPRRQKWFFEYAVTLDGVTVEPTANVVYREEPVYDFDDVAELSGEPAGDLKEAIVEVSTVKPAQLSEAVAGYLSDITSEGSLNFDDDWSTVVNRVISNPPQSLTEQQLSELFSVEPTLAHLIG
jgi:hypothetical protein